MSSTLGDSSIRVYSRGEWRARQARDLDAQAAPREAFLHHTADGDAESIRSLAAQKARMRKIQAQHMNVNGWSDGGYHFVVFQPYGNVPRARIFALRDWRKVPAAQIGHNTGTLAICVVGDFRSDVLKKNTRYAIEQFLVHHSAAKHVKTLGGHRDVVATECPGKNLYRWVERIAHVSGLEVYR